MLTARDVARGLGRRRTRGTLSATGPVPLQMSASDARICARIVLAHARTFALASRLLPPEKRRGAFAVYAFCRIADDIVDRAGGAGQLSEAERELDAYGAEVRRALDDASSRPVLRELSWAVRRFAIPRSALEELLRGVAVDLRVAQYDTWSDAERYCTGVASSVGEMCVAIFGVIGGDPEHQEAVRQARALGIAMQLTNILRDVGEDAERGRCYLPVEDLDRFGFSVDDVLTKRARRMGSSWQSLNCIGRRCRHTPCSPLMHGGAPSPAPPDTPPSSMP